MTVPQKRNGTPVCTPGKGALLVLTATMFGGLAVQELENLIAVQSAHTQSAIVGLVFVSTAIAIISYLVFKTAMINRSAMQDFDNERQILFGAAMTASMHYLGNAIASLQLIELEVEDSGTVCKETLTKISWLLEATKSNLQRLSAIDDPTAEKIIDYIRNDLTQP